MRFSSSDRWLRRRELKNEEDEKGAGKDNAVTPMEGSSPSSSSSDSVTPRSDALPPMRRGGISVPGQVLYPATKEDIEILSQSTRKYPSPKETEGSVIIRLVRLSDPVTSPVGRVMRNSQFGIRGTEKWQLLGYGILFSSVLVSLGVWQLEKMRWKQELIELRRQRMTAERLYVKQSPFPWTDKIDEFEYRTFEMRGVFDTTRMLKVGPRPQEDIEGRSVPGYLCVCPFLLEDGNTVLVNRGFIAYDKVRWRKEMPRWATIRGVLERGEIPNLIDDAARIKNRPQDGVFIYLVAKELAECSEARNYAECEQAFLSAYDVRFDDGTREEEFKMRHKEDYLLFWADEHTHFNYAMQWFGMAALTMSMTIYKFIEVCRWRW